jgi:hypothetical protein
MLTPFALLGPVGLASLSLGMQGAAGLESSFTANGQPICCLENVYCCFIDRSSCRR